MPILFTIHLDYPIDKAGFIVRLLADIEVLDSANNRYKACQFRRSNSVPLSLPDIFIEKKDNEWVHTDCGKESELSRAVGNKITEYLLALASSSSHSSE